MFLGNKNKVYILDKTENNPTTIDGKYGSHPAWAVEYDINTQKVRPMDVFSNTFCAGGAVLGNGTWAVFGGNQREYYSWWCNVVPVTPTQPKLVY